MEACTYSSVMDVKESGLLDFRILWYVKEVAKRGGLCNFTILMIFKGSSRRKWLVRFYVNNDHCAPAQKCLAPRKGHRTVRTSTGHSTHRMFHVQRAVNH